MNKHLDYTDFTQDVKKTVKSFVDELLSHNLTKEEVVEMIVHKLKNTPPENVKNSITMHRLKVSCAAYLSGDAAKMKEAHYDLIASIVYDDEIEDDEIREVLKELNK